MAKEFRKVLKKIRIDHEEVLKDMSKKLGVTASYLSAVENGKREIPDSWPEKIKTIYQLSAKESEELESAFYESKNEISINLSKLDSVKKQAAIAFAREFEEFTNEEIQDILNILKKK